MESGKISSLQMGIMMYPAIVATAILGVPSITAKYANTDLWMSPIIGSILGFVTVYVAYQLHKLYPKQTIIQFSEQVLGKFVGKLLGLLFLFFYIQLAGHVVRQYAEFVVDSFLIRTPISVIMGSMILLCAFVVRGGVEVLGRTAQLFLPLLIIPLLLLVILIFNDIDFKNILPILGGGIMPPIKGAIVPGAWYTEFFLIAFFLPFLSDVNKGMKAGMFSVIGAMVTLLLVNIIVLFVLGPTIPYKVYPLMNVARYISVADFFENMESVVMAIWVVGAFIKISVFYYATALGTAQLFKLSDYRPIVIPLGILIIAFGFWSLPSTMALEHYILEGFPLYAMLIQMIIPLILLMIALVRKRMGKGSQ